MRYVDQGCAKYLAQASTGEPKKRKVVEDSLDPLGNKYASRALTGTEAELNTQSERLALMAATPGKQDLEELV